MARIDLDDRAESVLGPVLTTVTRSLKQLPEGPPLSVRVDEVPGYFHLDAESGSIALSHHLLGPDLHHPRDAASAIPLDRWRRAAACVLEGASLLELARRTGSTPATNWMWVGAAAHAADRIAPELGVGASDLALAISSGDPGAHPRAGVGVMRAWEAEGADPLTQVVRLLDGGVISASEWVRLGAWVFSAKGGRASLPVPVDPVAAIDVPATLPAWSWRRIEVPSHPRGGRVRVRGSGAIGLAWAAANQPLCTVAGACGSGCDLETDPGGPIGEWEVSSAEGFGQVMGARGVTFRFAEDGRLQIVLADAFVGPLAAVSMADRMGTSGVCMGRWQVAGEQRLRFLDIETHGLTMHGRRDRFAVPAQGFGMGEWLHALGEGTWVWGHTDDHRLMLHGKMMGGDVQVRLRQATRYSASQRS